MKAAMPAINLRTIRPENLAPLVPPQVLARGRTYFRQGAVLSLECGEGFLHARVAGSRPQPYDVKIQEKGGGSLAIACTCPYAYDYGTCKHAVAVLLAWMAQRDGQPATAPAPAPRTFPAGRSRNTAGGGWCPPPRAKDQFVYSDFRQEEEDDWEEQEGDPFHEGLDGALAATGGLGMPLGGLAEAEQIEVDLHGNGPGLEIRLTLDDGWKATLVAPPHHVPKVLEGLRENRLVSDTVRWTPRAWHLRAQAAALVPELAADYDAEGHLVLTPRYRIKSVLGTGQTYPAEAVRQAQG